MSFELVAEPFFHYISFFFIFSMPIFIVLYGDYIVTIVDVTARNQAWRVAAAVCQRRFCLRLFSSSSALECQQRRLHHRHPSGD